MARAIPPDSPGLDTLGRFSALFYKGDNFCDFLFAFLHMNSLQMASKGDFSFSFRLFQKGGKTNLTSTSYLPYTLKSIKQF